MSCNSCMKRRTFLSTLTTIPAALLAVITGGAASRAGAGSMSGGAKRAPIPSDAINGLKPGDPKDFPKSGAWVVLNADKSLTAFDNKCTHRGCAYTWSAKNERFECPCHGSQFDITGKVIKGPASKPLGKLTIDKNAQGDVSLKG